MNDQIRMFKPKPPKLRKITAEQAHKEATDSDFQRWSSHVGMELPDGLGLLTQEMLETWSKDSNRKLWCIFCGDERPNNNWFCPGCHEYKGLVPSIHYQGD